FGVEVAIRTLFEAPTVARLARRLGDAGRARPPLVSQPRPAQIPLSYAQQRLWFLNQLGRTSAEYNMVEARRVRGSLDVDALTRALDALVARHESLRTHFAEVDGAPMQVIAAPAPAAIVTQDLRTLTPEAQAAAVKAALQEEATQPFDLATGPLLRVRLLILAPREHVLLWTLHHIVSDGWSQAVFNRELGALYAASRAGEAAALP